MEKDKEIEMLKAKKLLALRKRAEEQKEIDENKNEQKNDRELLMSRLVNRADEVFKIAETNYPRETVIITNRIMELVRSGAIKGNIDGGELLQIFRRLGLRVRLDSSIKIAKDGKVVSLTDKIKGKK
tara:strand:- start:105 stop:485 length:381 start_codon:yes stop_codon:yes gene_type:complete